MGRAGRRSTSLRRVAVCCALLVATAPAGSDVVRAGDAAPSRCDRPAPGAAYEARVRAALESGRDVWGAALVAAPEGPTLRGARRYLAPLLLARGPRGRPLTASGVYYLPFAQPETPRGAGTVALHVADGSQVVAQRIGGRTLSVHVGASGLERYGECLARLTPARLAGGYLPILQTGYVDATGARYRQESFAARVPETRSLVSFLRLSVDARRAGAAVIVRFVPSVKGLRPTGTTLSSSGRVELLFGRGASAGPAGAAYRVPAGARRTLYAAWLATPSPVRDLELDEAAYRAARHALRSYWEAQLSSATEVDVPEAAVRNAVRALLIQNLALTWRYSIGNPYEQFSFPESPDVARVLAEYGLGAVARSILRTSLTRDERRYPNWKRGSRLVASAQYYRLSGDAIYVRQATAMLRRFVAALERQITAGENGLLDRERYSSDIPDLVYGLHSQAVAWEGLRAMAGVWSELGYDALASRCNALATRLARGVRRAVRRSQRRLGDGSLFVPVSLLGAEAPYGLLVAERLGSYWNLVMPYALASGIFSADGEQANGVLRYMALHGSRLLGVARAGAYALYGREAYPASGTNHVYNTSVVRFLADNDQADQLVLSLYGALATGMTPNTFVSGEAASVAPVPGTPYRAMYLPPNSASNAAFLETVRELLVHETRGGDGQPNGLRLAYATPRAWLRPGRRVAVTSAPTSFGPVSFAIEAGATAATLTVDIPARRRPAFVGVRLRLPRGVRLGRVEVDGALHRRVDRASGTIDLSGTTGSVRIVASYSRDR